MDYKDLDNASVKDACLVPNIEPIFQRYQHKIATTVDQAEGCKQVERFKALKPFCLFATDWGFVKPSVISISLTNAPATFQHIMNEVLWDEIDNCCLVYLDEVLISSSSRDTNFRDVNYVCFRLTASRVRLKLVKCRIEQLEMQQLGHVITRELL